MRLEATRTIKTPKELYDVKPQVLKARVRELEGMIDEVTDVLRDMGAAEETIQVTLSMGYMFGYVKGSGEKPDEQELDTAVA